MKCRLLNFDYSFKKFLPVTLRLLLSRLDSTLIPGANNY